MFTWTNCTYCEPIRYPLKPKHISVPMNQICAKWGKHVYTSQSDMCSHEPNRYQFTRATQMSTDGNQSEVIYWLTIANQIRRDNSQWNISQSDANGECTANNTDNRKIVFRCRWMKQIKRVEMKEQQQRGKGAFSYDCFLYLGWPYNKTVPRHPSRPPPDVHCCGLWCAPYPRGRYRVSLCGTHARHASTSQWAGCPRTSIPVGVRAGNERREKWRNETAKLKYYSRATNFKGVMSLPHTLRFIFVIFLILD